MSCYKNMNDYSVYCNNEYIKLNLNEKRELIPHAVFLLRIAHSFSVYGVLHQSTLNQIYESSDEYLSFSCAAIISGYDPVFVEQTLKTFLKNESNSFLRKKMEIQSDAILTIKRVGSIEAVAASILSHLGMDFKDEFIELINEIDEEIFNLIFENGDFRNFNLKMHLNCSVDNER